MYYPAGFCDIFITGGPGRLRCKRIGDSIITWSICPACKSPARVIYDRGPDYAFRRHFFPAKLVFQESVHTSLLHGSCVARKLARRLAFVGSWRWLNKNWSSLVISHHRHPFSTTTPPPLHYTMYSVEGEGWLWERRCLWFHLDSLAAQKSQNKVSA